MEAPTSASALVDAATTLNAGVYLVSRTYRLFHTVSLWTHAVTWVGAITLLYAAVMALWANDLKIVLAYSTMSQLGYMFTAVGMGDILAGQFHMVSHAVFKALLFLSAGVVIHMTHRKQLDQLSGVGTRMPLTARCFMLGAMGLFGIPMLNGFFSKDMIFAAALASRQYLVLCFAWVGAVLTFTYTWRTYRRVFGGEPSPAVAGALDAPLAMSWPLCILGVSSPFSWLLIGVQSRFVHAASENAEIISPLYLMEETFVGPAFLLSALVLAIGGVIVWGVENGRICGVELLTKDPRVHRP
jgi:NADH-quinone oxidoreductase subunit L